MFPSSGQPSEAIDDSLADNVSHILDSEVHFVRFWACWAALEPIDPASNDPAFTPGSAPRTAEQNIGTATAARTPVPSANPPIGNQWKPFTASDYYQEIRRQIAY